MSAGPFNVDSKSILIDALKQEGIKFQLSNLILKNGKALTAIYEIRALKAELMDFAKDPSVGIQNLGPKPKPPKIRDDASEDDRIQIEDEYAQLLDLYEMEKKALTMHVPVADMITINNYLEKFEDTLAATPAVKGRRFQAFTKQLEEEQGGLAGFFNRKRQQQG